LLRISQHDHSKHKTFLNMTE
jgi:hypothetical protein